uniref:Uncharacterized protein n=1 Tax=Lepeophtheirus salmonis TaxID=72036 RepID=A0A0K2V7N7_LEPSM
MFVINRLNTNIPAFPGVTMILFLISANITTANYWGSSTTSMDYFCVSYCPF